MHERGRRHARGCVSRGPVVQQGVTNGLHERVALGHVSPKAVLQRLMKTLNPSIPLRVVERSAYVANALAFEIGRELSGDHLGTIVSSDCLWMAPARP